MKSIIVKELKILLREKGNFFWLFVLPIVFIVLFATVFGSVADTITIHYVDEDQSEASAAFVKGLEKIKGFAVKQNDKLSIEEQVTQLKKGKTNSLIVIPKGFGKAFDARKEPATITFYRDAAADQSVAPIEAVLKNMESHYRNAKLKAVFGEMGIGQKDSEQLLAAPIRIEEVKENAVKLDMVTQVVPGYTVMFVFFIMITMANRMLKDKEGGTLARLRSTPMKPLDYLVGMWVPPFIVTCIQCVVLLAFGYFVYDLHVGDVLAVSLLIVCLNVCATGLGLALALFVKNENQGVAFTQIIAMGGAVFGGLWFPFEFMPRIMQAIGQFTPQYWAQRGLQDVMLRGAHTGDVWLSLVILLAFSFVGVSLALLRFNRFIQSAES
ncbi:ABC transporter permease [Numidum massiliense]|uniref:ABC transporter permease n=1 Tax=Numidum massiliense TaxID=1522315 RepID=UPI0006D5A493|nr:ABC transporter permease [Numidum massiliense]